MSRRYVVSAPVPEQEQSEIDGVPVRFKLDRGNETERAEAFWQGKWHVLWTARKTSKGGKQAWTLRQQDLKKAVWKLVNGGTEPRVCSSCGLMVEATNPALIRVRSCKVCKSFQS